MSNTLVVGGKGYIGRHLKNIFPDFIYVGREEFDLKEKKQISVYCQTVDIDTCIILSATIGYEKHVDFLSEPFSTNVEGLNNLLDVLKEKNKEMKIIYFSSMTVYAQNNTSPVQESSNLAPLHSYGLSKVYAEALVKYYDLRSVIIRIPGIYGGDRQSGLIYNTVHKLKQGEAINIDTSTLGYWETLHIDDMLLMFSGFLDRYKFDDKFSVFNIAYGEKTDFISTIQFIKKQLKSNSIITVNRKYRDFYLSNAKVLTLTSKPMPFKERLEQYIGELL